MRLHIALACKSVRDQPTEAGARTRDQDDFAVTHRRSVLLTITPDYAAGRVNPGRIFMTNTSCGAPVADRAISWDRTFITDPRSPQICVDKVFVRTIKSG